MLIEIVISFVNDYFEILHMLVDLGRTPPPSAIINYNTKTDGRPNAWNHPLQLGLGKELRNLFLYLTTACLMVFPTNLLTNIYCTVNSYVLQVWLPYLVIISILTFFS